jgi:hypothetical protein
VSYANTFIRVADDCPVDAAEVPAARARPSVAELQHRLLSEHPYELTEEQLYVRVHGLRQGLDERAIEDRYEALRAELYAKPQACLRASPLTKRYGFGAHYDACGRIALHAREGASYARLANDPGVEQLAAMRSARR